MIPIPLLLLEYMYIKALNHLTQDFTPLQWGPRGCHCVSLRLGTTGIKAHHLKETEGHVLIPGLVCFVSELQGKVE